MTSELFADTSFWIALLSYRDTYHANAVAWSKHVSAMEITLVTTEAVLWEWLNSMSRPDVRQVVIAAYERCKLDPHIDVIGFEHTSIAEAIALYKSR